MCYCDSTTPSQPVVACAAATRCHMNEGRVLAASNLQIVTFTSHMRTVGCLSVLYGCMLPVFELWKHLHDHLLAVQRNVTLIALVADSATSS